jgi:hypothetical protein
VLVRSVNTEMQIEFEENVAVQMVKQMSSSVRLNREILTLMDKTDVRPQIALLKKKLEKLNRLAEAAREAGYEEDTSRAAGGGSGGRPTAVPSKAKVAGPGVCVRPGQGKKAEPEPADKGKPKPKKAGSRP